MGKTWDGTGIAFSLTMWDEIYRVLRPGGVVKAFSGDAHVSPHDSGDGRSWSCGPAVGSMDLRKRVPEIHEHRKGH